MALDEIDNKEKTELEKITSEPFSVHNVTIIPNGEVEYMRENDYLLIKEKAYQYKGCVLMGSRERDYFFNEEDNELYLEDGTIIYPK